MQLGNWQFSPRLWPSIATLIFFPVLLSLGFWQLDRAEQKRQIHQQYLSKQTAETMTLNNFPDLRGNRDVLMWQRVLARGTFSDVHILLDNQVVNGMAGYYVLTPFALDGEHGHVLVNRGWIAAGDDRTRVPEFETAMTETEITGVVKDVPTTGIVLGEPVPEKMIDKIVRVQRVSIEEMTNTFAPDLLPFVIRLTPDSNHGFVRNWPEPDSGVNMHLGYAFQWFALAITLIIIFLVVNTHKVTNQ